MTKLTENSQPKIGPEKKCVYHTIPFINDKSANYVKNELTSLIKIMYPQIDFKPVFTNTRKIQGFLNHKDKVPDELRSCVSYKFTCGDCGALYLGSSLKSLRARAAEHFGISSRTGALLARPLQSSIREHIESCKYTKDINNFKVLREFQDQNTLRTFESIEIQITRPSLNIDNTAVNLFLL